MRYRRLNLNLLVALDVLLEECSVSRAAQRLNLGQSATSAALGRLREHFQGPLLPAQTSDNDPTPAPAQLLDTLALTTAKPVTPAVPDKPTLFAIQPGITAHDALTQQASGLADRPCRLRFWRPVGTRPLSIEKIPLDSLVPLNPCTSLASDNSSFVTGMAARIGGGASITRL